MRAFDKLKKSITTDNIWVYILSILNREKIHAYGLRKRIKEVFEWQPELITLYVVLYRIEKEGLIKSIIKGRKREYSITKKGKDMLNKAKYLLNKTSENL